MLLGRKDNLSPTVVKIVVLRHEWASCSGLLQCYKCQLSIRLQAPETRHTNGCRLIRRQPNARFRVKASLKSFRGEGCKSFTVEGCGELGRIGTSLFSVCLALWSLGQCRA